VDWTTVLTALISAAAALAGYVIGYRIEERRSSEARKARHEERDWQRRERKRQELSELQQGLGDFVVIVTARVSDALPAYTPTQPWHPSGGFFQKLYEAQLHALFLATQTADEGVYEAARDVVGQSEVVQQAKNPDDAVRAIAALTGALGRADNLIFERLKTIDGGLGTSPTLVVAASSASSPEST